jgi:hypothetical protein
MSDLASFANHFAALKKAERDGREAPGSYDAAVADLWRTNPALAEKINLPKPME